MSLPTLAANRVKSDLGAACAGFGGGGADLADESRVASTIALNSAVRSRIDETTGNVMVADDGDAVVNDGSGPPGRRRRIGSRDMQEL